MKSALLNVLLLSGLAIFRQVVGENCSEYKSDGVFNGKVVQNSLNLTYFDDCEHARHRGFRESGVYRIKPTASVRPFPVWCDMNDYDDGGWIVIQTRFDGLVDFERTWKEYRNGFGNVDSEHWLGNNFIRQITQNNDYELKIELTGYNDTATEYATAKYSPFRIGSEDEKYKLYVGAFTNGGGVPDRMSFHNGAMFTTTDSDNDIWPGNCADFARGGWWYVNCYHSNLNGLWMSEGQSVATQGPQTIDNRVGIVWQDLFNERFYSLKSVEMKVRKIKK